MPIFKEGKPEKSSVNRALTSPWQHRESLYVLWRCRREELLGILYTFIRNEAYQTSLSADTYTAHWVGPAPLCAWCSARCTGPSGTGTAPSCPCWRSSAWGGHRASPPRSPPTASAGPFPSETTAQADAACRPPPSTPARRCLPLARWPPDLRVEPTASVERLEGRRGERERERERERESLSLFCSTSIPAYMNNAFEKYYVFLTMIQIAGIKENNLHTIFIKKLHKKKKKAEGKSDILWLVNF